MKEFIALARRKPGELTVAASGSGSTGHVASAMFSSRAGIKLLDVQYKGAAPAVIDLVGGHVMVRFDQVTTSLPLMLKQGTERATGIMDVDALELYVKANPMLLPGKLDRITRLN